MDNSISGRPSIDDEQFHTWLDEMAPFLKMGNSLYFAMDKALLGKHKDSIYRKFKLNDWFCEKIEAFQKYPGEIVNSIFVRVVMSVDEKIRLGSSVSSDEWRNLRFFAEKHRTCQQFFTTRTETVQTDENKIAQVLDQLERDNQKTDYSLLAQNAKKQLDKFAQTPT